MNIKKMSGSLVAATLLLGLNTVVMADEHCDKAVSDAITQTEELATVLRCKSDGLWPSDNPIWVWKGKAIMGCTVHEKLAKQLNEEREEDLEPMPPYKGKKTKNGNNVAAGAANDLRNGKIESALGHYLTFMDVIYSSAKQNDDPEWDVTGFASAAAAAQFFFDEAEHLHTMVSKACPL